MKTLVKTERLRAACRFVVAFACLGCLLIGPAVAQVRDKPAPPAAAKEPPPERILQVFRLKYAKAEEMLQLVKAPAQEAGIASVAVDARTNSLVILGTPAGMKAVKELIAQFDRPEPSPPERVVQVFLLKYRKAEDIAQLLSELQESDGAQLVVDEPTNSLVFRGTAGTAKRIGERIAQFDRPEPSPPQRVVMVFHLAHADPESLTKLLAKLVETREARLAADPRTRSIVLQAPPDTARVVEALLLKLDTEVPGPAGRPGAAYQVRIVWLAGGPPSKDPFTLPKGFEPVVEELDSLGIENLRQVGQVQVNTAPDGKFQISCSPLFNGDPVELRADGKLEVKSGVAQMMLRISAVRQPGPAAGPPGAGQSAAPAKRQLVEIETIISPRTDGSYLVLGVAPIEKVTSVFVVQVTEKRQP